VSPVADPATRTYAVKVAIPGDAEARLGMSATVQFVSRSGSGQLRVPLTALHQDKGDSALWVIENGVVRLVPVGLGAAVGNEVLVTRGVEPGQTIVTAGVNLLKNGQKVRILTADVSRRAGADSASGAAQ
jgi:multidrug efflux system membrane fusion protein